MENNIIKSMVFKNRNVTVLSRESEILFDPKEIGEILGLSERTIENKVTELTEKEKIHLSKSQAESLFQGTRSEGGLGNFGKTYLTEVGLYVFISTSKTQMAIEFNSWVFGEVIPSIRKHGVYATPQTIDQMLENPDLLIEALQKLKKEREEKLAAIEAKEKAEKERIWIRTKAEATAMATASVKSREVERLKLEMGEHKDYASVLRVAIATNKTEHEYNWRDLRKYSLAHNLEIHEIPDPRFGKAKTYHKDAWYNLYDVDLEELF